MGFLRSAMVISPDSPAGRITAKRIKVALLFPGQGSQAVGMGREISGQFPQARAVFEMANEVLGIDLQKICFEGPEQELVPTQNQQPALLATSLACWEAFRSQGIGVDIVGCAGLSLGEYTALAVAGSLSSQDALNLVRARGTFMQEACDAAPSGMACLIGLAPDAVKELCRTVAPAASGLVLDIANINCPGQIVVSGHRDAIEQVIAKVQAMEQARAVVLNVAGAFHSWLMQSAADKLTAVLKGISFKSPAVGVMTNVTGKKIGNPQEIQGLLVRQITSSVLWEECVRSLIACKPDLFLEVGSGKVLTGLLRKIDRNALCLNIEDSKSLTKAVEFIGQLQAA